MPISTIPEVLQRLPGDRGARAHPQGRSGISLIRCKCPRHPGLVHRSHFRLMIGKHAPARDLGVTPVIRIDTPYRLDAFGIDGTILPTPGHTRGSLSVSLATGECIAGDLINGTFLTHRARSRSLPRIRKRQNRAYAHSSIRRQKRSMPATAGRSPVLMWRRSCGEDHGTGT